MMRFTPPKSRVLHRQVLILTCLRFLLGVGLGLFFARTVFDPAQPTLFWVVIVCTVLYGSVSAFSWTRLYRSYALRAQEERKKSKGEILDRS
jgi:thiol:disulfide interchange protein